VYDREINIQSDDYYNLRMSKFHSWLARLIHINNKDMFGAGNRTQSQPENLPVDTHPGTPKLVLPF